MSKETLEYGMGLLRLGSSDSTGDLDAQIQAGGDINIILYTCMYVCVCIMHVGI